MVQPRGLAVKLKRLRKNRGLTQEALARKANISLGYVARLEIGRHDPKVGTLRKIARALGVPVTELLS
jgi:transcriptional regulator with XRE-family HTH domain